MSFVTSLFGSGPQQAQIDKGATPEQAKQLYGQVQNGISQQQSFVDAVNAQGGLANQNSVYQQLAGIANGTGPSVAQNQLAQATQANVANQAAMAAGVRGASQNAGLIARQAANAGAGAQQAAAGQAATLRSQEAMGAINSMGQVATNQVGQQQSAIANLNQATQGAQGNVLNAINGQNNAAVASQNNVNAINQSRNSAIAGAIGGLAGGVATGGMSLLAGGAKKAATGLQAGGMDSMPGTVAAAHGGMIEGTPPVPGVDTPKNDVVNAKVSPGEIVIPLSVLESEDPVKAAAHFVSGVLAGQGPKPAAQGDSKQAFASGGRVEDVFAPIRPGPGMSQDTTQPDYTYNPTPNQFRMDQLSTLAPTTFDRPTFDPSAAAANASAEARMSSGIDKSNMSSPSMPQSLSAEAPSPASMGPSSPPQALAGSAPPGAGGTADPYGFDAMSKTMMGGYNQMMGGYRQNADAESKLATQQADIAKQQIADTQSAQQRYQQHYNELDTDRKNFQEQLATGKVDPDHYLSSMSGGQRVGTAIGLILGGLSAGLTGKENPGSEFLNKQIDRDIDSQKTNLQKTDNLLKANMAQFGNLRDAENMTRVQLADIYSAKLAKAGAESGSQAAQARANVAIGDLQTKIAPLVQQTAMRKAMLGGGAEQSPEKMMQYFRMTDPAKAKEMEERYVPGVGMASVPVSETSRKEITARQDLSMKLSQLENFARQHSGSLDPKIIAQGKALAADVQNGYRTGNQMGVFKEGEQGFVEKIIDSDPTKLASNFRTIPGYKVTRQNNDAQLGSLLKAHGLSRPKIDFEKGS